MEEFPTQLMPSILVEDAAYRIDAASGTESIDLEGLIDPLHRIDLWWKSIEFHGAAWRMMHSNATDLEGLLRHLNRCC